MVFVQLGELPNKTEGTLLGIPMVKGRAWIEVKEDEGYSSHCYRPSRNKGVPNGWVLGKGGKWVDVSSAKFESPTRCYARWVGGVPAKGGGCHEPTLAFLEEPETAEQMKLNWTYDVFPRIPRINERALPESPFLSGYPQPCQAS